MGVFKYILIGYALVVLLPLVAMGSLPPASFLTVVILAGAIWAYRSGVFRRQIGPASTVEIPEPTPVAGLPPAHQPAASRVGPRLTELERELTEDPLESPLMLDLAELYEHEPPEDRNRLDEEYREQRARLVECRAAFERGEPVEADVASIEAFVRELRETAAGAADDPVAAALEATGRASRALEAARAQTSSVAGDVATELAERLDWAGKQLERAEAAFARGAERPLVALRLAHQAERAANEVRDRAERLEGLPDELARRLPEFDRAAARVDRDLARVKEEFRTASQQYAATSWHDVRGVGAAAEQAAERAQRRRAAAGAKALAAPAQAKEELDEAFDALERAEDLVEKITTHLARLEDASLTARDRVADAERALETAVTAATGEPDAALRRAEELVAEARQLLAQERPDWLRVVELASRAQGLVEGRPAPASAREADERLQIERERAKEARDDAWAQGLVSDEVHDLVRPLLDEVETAYQAALRKETEGGSDSLAAYTAAERRAREAREQIAMIYAERLTERARRLAREHGDEAQLLVWGGVRSQTR